MSEFDVIRKCLPLPATAFPGSKDYADARAALDALQARIELLTETMERTIKWCIGCGGTGQRLIEMNDGAPYHRVDCVMCNRERAALSAPIGSTERSTRANIPNDGHDDVDDMSDWPDADGTGSGEPVKEEG